VSAGDTSCVDTQHHTEARYLSAAESFFLCTFSRILPPAPRNGLVVALGTIRENNLRDHTITEQDQAVKSQGESFESSLQRNSHENTKELAEWLSHVVPDPTPGKVGLLLNNIGLRNLVVDQRPVLGKGRDTGNGAGAFAILVMSDVEMLSVIAVAHLCWQDGVFFH
jgi:hypothetical protein